MKNEKPNNPFDKALEKAYSIFNAKGNDYGDSWKSLGSKGIFVYLFNKIMRLKNLQWENNSPKFESIEDNALDLLVYAIMYYALIIEEKEKKK